ncbi:MFS transporter [Occultella aeris]|uniref:MFS transporter n=1 Tax=Occultella aeris TaxID=2761496 RepID=UPI0018D436B1|nr:MFS transporter [Occultella aeris]
MLCLTQIVGWGVLYYSFPVALPAITTDTGWPATSTLVAFSAALVVAAGAGVAVGRVIDRHGPRWVMTGGSVLATGAVVVIAWAPNLGWFVTGWVIAGLAQSMVLYAPAFTAITRWYGPARNRALLTVTLVAGLASTIFAPVTAALLEQSGWRHTYLVLAAALALTTIPAHALGLRAPWPPHRHSRDQGDRSGQGPRAIARSRAFVALTVATSLGAFAMFAATIHLIPMLTWRGLSATAAAWALGLSGAGQLAGRLAYAPLARGTTPVSRAVAILALAGAGVAAVGLLPGPGLVLVGAAIGLGVVRGAYTLLQSTVISDRWGTEGFGALYGILNAPATLAMALAPWVAGVLTDATGSYPVTFAILAGAAGLAAVVATRTAPRRTPELHLHPWGRGE